MLTLYAFKLAALSGVTLLCLVTARIFNRCEFGYELLAKGIEQNDWERDIPKWLCLANHTTGYNTLFFADDGNRRGYGILRISNDWCLDNQTDTTNLCNVNCSQLQGDDITETVNCANTIFNSENSWVPWNPHWVSHCQDNDSTPYIQGCQDTIGNRPVVELRENEINAVVTCRARGYPKITNMTWEWDTMDTDTDVSPNFDPIPIDIDYFNTLTFTKVRIEHEGEYACYSENANGNTTTVFEVVVVPEGVTDFPITTDATSDGTDATTDPTTTNETTVPSTVPDTTDHDSTVENTDASTTYPIENSTTTDTTTDFSGTDGTTSPTTSDTTLVFSTVHSTTELDSTVENTDPSSTDPTKESTIKDTTTDSSDTSATTELVDTSATTELVTTDETPTPSTVRATTDHDTTVENTVSSTTDPTEDSTSTNAPTDSSGTDSTTESNTSDKISDSTTVYTTDHSTTMESTELSTTETSEDSTITDFTSTGATSGPSSPDDTTHPSTSTTTVSIPTTNHPPTTIVSTSPTSSPTPSTSPPDNGIVYEFCELAEQLTYLNDDSIDWNDHLHTWLCMSERTTGFNGTYVWFNSTADEFPPTIFYGLFKISNRWCRDVFDRENRCNTTCEDLVGSDLKANVMCSNIIRQDEGFQQWPEYEYCADYSPDNLWECEDKGKPVFLSAGGADLNTVFREHEKRRNLTCSVRGYPPPQLKWDDSTLNYISQSGDRVFLDPRGPIKERLTNGSWIVQYTLFFDTVKVSDERVYLCDATNTFGNATQSRQVTVISEEPSWRKPLLIAGISFLILLVLLALVLAYLYYRVQKKKHQNLIKIYEQFKHGNQTGSDFGSDGFPPESEYFTTAAEFQTYRKVLDLPFSKALEILPHQLSVLRSMVLGVGAFGIVFKGVLGGRKEVAVKTLVDREDDEKLSSLLSEVKIMSYVGRHPNIVQLLGVEMFDLRRGIVHVALEYCSRGSLKDILQQKRKELEMAASPVYNFSVAGYLNQLNIGNPKPFSEYQLLTFCQQVCTAMEYLTSKWIIHGDLAARNVLVDANFVAKISDFGLSRQMSDTYKKYIVASKETSLPWRWLAIETLNQLKFSSESDVWAYGVFMWEVFSLAELPYGASISFSPNFVNYLEGGFRLQIPKFATVEIHELMRRCWDKEPSDRIKFKEMSTKLLGLLQLEYSSNSQGFRRRGYYLHPY